jgi:hypothetical protein
MPLELLSFHELLRDSDEKTGMERSFRGCSDTGAEEKKRKKKGLFDNPIMKLKIHRISSLTSR